MSVTPNQITLYGSLKMPEADGVMVGGVPDITKRVAFYDLSTNGTVDVVSSSGSDTATKIQISGRDSTGVIQTPASVTVTGTTLIANAFGQSFSRLLYGIISGGNTVSGSTPAALRRSATWLRSQRPGRFPTISRRPDRQTLRAPRRPCSILRAVTALLLAR